MDQEKDNQKYKLQVDEQNLSERTQSDLLDSSNISKDLDTTENSESANLRQNQQPQSQKKAEKQIEQLVDKINYENSQEQEGESEQADEEESEDQDEDFDENELGTEEEDDSEELEERDDDYGKQTDKSVQEDNDPESTTGDEKIEMGQQLDDVKNFMKMPRTSVFINCPFCGELDQTAIKSNTFDKVCSIFFMILKIAIVVTFFALICICLVICCAALCKDNNGGSMDCGNCDCGSGCYCCLWQSNGGGSSGCCNDCNPCGCCFRDDGGCYLGIRVRKVHSCKSCHQILGYSS